MNNGDNGKSLVNIGDVSHVKPLSQVYATFERSALLGLDFHELCGELCTALMLTGQPERQFRQVCSII
jgi:hypothetical protein